MSQLKPKDTDETREPETDPAARDRAELGPPPDPDDTDAVAGLKYVFRIAPADPKNALDFEDIADK